MGVISVGQTPLGWRSALVIVRDGFDCAKDALDKGIDPVERLEANINTETFIVAVLELIR